MIEDGTTFAEKCFDRARRLVEHMERLHPDMTGAQRVMLLASATGIVLAKDAFPNRPGTEPDSMMKLWQAMVPATGVSAGLQIRHMIEAEKAASAGRA